MKQDYILIKPILSEKAYKGMESSAYTFLVAKEATKNQVAAVVKAQFGVEVKRVNITPLYAKSKRIAKTRKFTTVSEGGKKAIVYLKSGQKIAALSPKTETKGKTKQKPGGEKDVQKVQIEGKEGA